MSFDLAVFRPKKRLDTSAAVAVYEALTTKGAAAPRALAPTNALAAFYDELTSTYPEIDDDPDESPFAVAIERRSEALIVNLSFSRVDEVAYAIEQLAKTHGLDVYDPQGRKLLRASDPDSQRRPAPVQKLSPKEGLARFVDGVGKKLEALGFPPVPKAKYTWGRASRGGVLQRVSLNLGTREVRTDVAVGHERVLPWLAAATGRREPLPSMNLGDLRLRGWIPGEPWRGGDAEIEYEICHADCVAKSVKAFARDVERFAVPFFDALGSVEQVADFFERKKTFAKPRANWGLEREKAAGPSERFWREDRGLLLEVAMRVLADPSSLDAAVAEAKRRGAVWTKKDIHGGSPQLAGMIAALAEAIRETSSSSTRTLKPRAVKKPRPRARSLRS